jgi:hypothetical protein
MAPTTALNWHWCSVVGGGAKMAHTTALIWQWCIIVGGGGADMVHMNPLFPLLPPRLKTHIPYRDTLAAAQFWGPHLWG